METIFRDRRDAGQRLAQKITHYHHSPDALVLGLARGGVIVAHEVASALELPLDVLCPRKIGAPNNPELAAGAITEDGSIFLNPRVMGYLGLSIDNLAPIIERSKEEAARQVALYRRGKSLLSLKNKKVIIVDDGLATGATMRAAIEQVRKAEAQRIIIAVPVAPLDTWEEIKALVEEGLVLLLPSNFNAVGIYYADFSSTSDEEVISCLTTTKPL